MPTGLPHSSGRARLPGRASGDLPVLSRVEPGAVRAALPAAPPDEPEPFAAVLQDLDEVLLPGITHWNHPRFFAYFATSGSEPGILAELLAATLNVNAMLWRTSPAATELEELVLDWVAQLIGPPGGASRPHRGHRLHLDSRRACGRPRASPGRHRPLLRAGALLGREGRPDPRPGGSQGGGGRSVPACGPTRSPKRSRHGGGGGGGDRGDHVRDLGRPRARGRRPGEQAGAWLHVDAAYAGSAMVCEELRWALEGCERADSLVVNPHKWLFTPVDCSCLFSRRPEVLRRAFSLVPEYLRSDEEATNLMDYGPALGRRFRALKLWAVIRCYGRSGLQARIREHVRLAQLFASWVEAEPGWEVVAPVPFSVVCFRREGSDEENEAIVERANATGEVFLSPTVLRDRTVLRLAIGNVRTTEADVERAWAVLRKRPPAGRVSCVAGPLLVVTATDYHTAGEPFRIVTGGVPPIPGARSSRSAAGRRSTWSPCASSSCTSPEATPTCTAAS